VTSNSEMQDLRLICNHKNILCLELGVEIALVDRVKPKSTNHMTRFIFLSRIHPKKQLNLLLEALSYLYKEHNQELWHLSIAGEGEHDYVEFLKQLAMNYGISDHLEWLGHVSGEKKVNLLATSDWFVLPSQSENFGLSVIEALAHGVPVIITREVGISDLVKEYNAGLVCESPIELAESLVTALKGAPMDMRYAALDLVRARFSWSKIAKKLKLFYMDQLKAT